MLGLHFRASLYRSDEVDDIEVMLESIEVGNLFMKTR